MMASFSSCFSGTKLCNVTTSETSGKASSLVAKGDVSPSDGARILIAFGEVSVFFINSSNVATDSALALRRLSGLKSNLSLASSGRPATTTISVPIRIGIRYFAMNRSTGASDR